MKEPMNVNEEFLYMFEKSPDREYYTKELINSKTSKSSKIFKKSANTEEIPKWLTEKEIVNIRHILKIVTKLKKLKKYNI